MGCARRLRCGWLFEAGSGGASHMLDEPEGASEAAGLPGPHRQEGRGRVLYRLRGARDLVAAPKQFVTTGVF